MSTPHRIIGASLLLSTTCSSAVLWPGWPPGRPLMLGDEMPEQGTRGPRSLGGTPVSFFLYTENVDASWKGAVDAGGKPVVPLDNQFWGDRAGCLEDPAGHQWWLSQRIKDMSVDELRKSAEEFFSSAQGSHAG